MYVFIHILDILEIFINLLDSKLVWEGPHYKERDSSINESTWAHDMIDSICKFITFGISELRISW